MLRGVVYAIAHIRGGGEMGRHWYEDEGKYLTKMNTFTDFGDCAAHLIRRGTTARPTRTTTPLTHLRIGLIRMYGTQGGSHSF